MKHIRFLSLLMALVLALSLLPVTASAVFLEDISQPEVNSSPEDTTVCEQPLVSSPIADQTQATFVPQWPAPGYTISTMYYYKDGSKHGGRWDNHYCMDIAVTGNATSIESGTVTFAGWDTTGFGNCVIISHSNGASSLYGHLASYSVAEGDSVQKGQVIGVIGSTGNSSGVHLHFEYSAGNPWDLFFKESLISNFVFESNCYSNSKKYYNTDSQAKFFCDWLDMYYTQNSAGQYIWNGTVPKVDVGTNFYAYIINTGNWMHLTNDSNRLRPYNGVN